MHENDEDVKMSARMSRALLTSSEQCVCMGQTAPRTRREKLAQASEIH